MFMIQTSSKVVKSIDKSFFHIMVQKAPGQPEQLVCTYRKSIYAKKRLEKEASRNKNYFYTITEERVQIKEELIKWELAK